MESAPVLSPPEGLPKSEPIDVGNTVGSTMVYFTHRLLDFREAELTAVAEMSGIAPSDLELRQLSNDMPFSPLRLVSSLNDEQAKAIANRAVLVKVREREGLETVDILTCLVIHTTVR
jgi:hypothetical protein